MWRTLMKIYILCIAIINMQFYDLNPIVECSITKRNHNFFFLNFADITKLIHSTARWVAKCVGHISQPTIEGQNAWKERGLYVNLWTNSSINLWPIPLCDALICDNNGEKKTYIDNKRKKNSHAGISTWYFLHKWDTLPHMFFRQIINSA